ncbi:hypothetical protein Taro_003919 [Colocasia esculenta]|uniref:Uncharacterized protein n=1 Tax=Colocasia esculenta TaxID=4460 RepID=A0A843TL25_COLES|nr:hypothetical protein [Colocasia esculenta]
MTSISPSEKARTQRTTKNQYPQEIQVPTTAWYHHWNSNTTVPPLGHTTTSQITTKPCQHHGTPRRIKPQPIHDITNSKAQVRKHDATTRDRLLVHDASIQSGQHNTRTTSQSHSHRHKVQLSLHNTSKAKELWRPTKPPQPTGHTPCRPMPGTFRDSGLSSLK